ncbi:MAG: tetratricopeptide repeat protein [Desulfobacterales bacterium]|nr:tetratricopeptide repeat protein [Deltaproteobacteria bacterium]NNK93203.1 tetratricopeptide repeat protein [Desulfobacterales bacterium]
MMAEGNVFDKRHIDESEKNDLGGVLEQLNLPPSVVKFVRENKLLVQVSIAVILIAVVAFSLYGSYRKEKIQNGANALSVAMEQEGQARIESLLKVESEFSGTSSALWAKISSAHEMVKENDVENARQYYQDIRAEAGKSSPLQPLLALGIAQTSEILKQYQQARTEYEFLKTQTGFKNLGYSGLARIYEIQGEKQLSLQVYEEFLGTLGDGGSQLEKVLVEEKIARIKASL